MTEMQPFNDASDLLETPAALRSEMQTNGYLFLPGLLQPETVGEVYAEILRICQQQGWADAHGHPQGPPRLEGHDEFWEVYDPVQQLESFHALAHRPEILHVIEMLVQETPFPHPRNIARITFPQAEHFTTPPHQDHALIQGTPETYTVWMPLSDCPQELGCLTVLAGSHTRSLLPIHKASGPGGVGVDTEDLGLEWHGSDFQAGDVLIFHSHTVHKALPNRTSDRLRISVDFRYQGASQPIVEDGLLPHYGRLSWDEIYVGWSRPALQYYWRDAPLKIVERDRSLLDSVRST
jgi:hypothetical protein